MTYSNNYAQMLDRGGGSMLTRVWHTKCVMNFLWLPPRNKAMTQVLLDKDTVFTHWPRRLLLCFVWDRENESPWNSHPFGNCQHMWYSKVTSDSLLPALLLVTLKTTQIFRPTGPQQVNDRSVLVTNMLVLSPSGPGPGILWSGGKTFHSNLVE